MAMELTHGNLQREAMKLGVEAVEYSDVDPAGWEIFYGDKLIFTKVAFEDRQLLKALIVIRLLNQCKKPRP
jgi:hypothetical protein